MLIDFIAYHELQAQAALSVFEKLKSVYDCRWLIGPFNAARPGDVAILIDHRCYHHICKSRNGYKYLFHLSHDIADIDVYKNENLGDFDLIFVPTIAHYNACLNSGYEARKLKISGWPKYDYIANKKLVKDVLSKVVDRSRLCLLYAPTFAGNYEWKKLFPVFKSIGCEVLIKNHIYVDEGQNFPPGQEEEYSIALASAQEMESVATELGFSISPRPTNICTIFNRADILVSDASSCLIEFLPFGVAIETGGSSVGDLRYKPETSVLSEDVMLLPVDKFVQVDCDFFYNLVKVFSLRGESSIVEYKHGHSVGSHIAEQINMYIKTNSPRYAPWWEAISSSLRKIKYRFENR